MRPIASVLQGYNELAVGDCDSDLLLGPVALLEIRGQKSQYCIAGGKSDLKDVFPFLAYLDAFVGNEALNPSLGEMSLEFSCRLDMAGAMRDKDLEIAGLPRIL